MFKLDVIENKILEVKYNPWYKYFYVFCRISLAFGFFTAGMVKILGERFASGLSELHPMGAYLEALFRTGYYYTFIGIAQVMAAILLLIPKTVILGALLYLPIITNIFILIWHYDKLKYVLPTHQFHEIDKQNIPIKKSRKFPVLFFVGVLLSVSLTIIYAQFGHDVMPRNSYSDCVSQFSDREDNKAGVLFCDCIHKKGKPLNQCLELYE